MSVNPIKARLKAGAKMLAAWVFSGDPDVAEILARAGYPVIVICYEHGIGDTADLGDLLRAVRAGGAEPLLRVPSADPGFLKRVLDGGARSIMVPMVESVAEARAIVDACRYPPLGRRGYAATVVRAGGFGYTADYAATAHEELFLALQVETPAGVEAAAGIAALDGVDMLFVGPNDLANFMGHPGRMDAAPVLAAIDRTIAAAKAAGKGLGIVPHAGRDASACASLGFDIVAGIADVAVLREAAVADVARHRAAFGM